KVAQCSRSGPPFAYCPINASLCHYRTVAFFLPACGLSCCFNVFPISVPNMLKLFSTAGFKNGLPLPSCLNSHMAM
ncbi:MAG: hypothetical protein ACK6EB_27545, partial [Planctomyces sp.]